MLFEYIGFLSSFWMLGAIGFRYGILRAGTAMTPAGRAFSPLTGAFRGARSGAASIGLLGVGLGVVSLIEGSSRARSRST